MDELAVQTLERFETEGVKCAPRDVARLDAAARRMRRAKLADGEGLLCAPRAAFCGGVVFHEPTVQSDLWMLEVAGEVIPTGWIAEATGRNAEVRFWVRAFALAHADEPGFFSRPEMHDARAVSAAVDDFARKLAATRRQVEDAVVYCVFGDDEEDAAPEPREDDGTTRRDDIYQDLAEAVGLTGAAIDDLKRLTVPMLRRAIRRAWELGERQFRNEEATRALVAWQKLIEEIRGKEAQK
jgi:hypothetical protein